MYEITRIVCRCVCVADDTTETLAVWTFRLMLGTWGFWRVYYWQLRTEVTYIEDLIIGRRHHNFLPEFAVISPVLLYFNFSMKLASLMTTFYILGLMDPHWRQYKWRLRLGSQEKFPIAWSVRHVKYSWPNDWVGT